MDLGLKSVLITGSSGFIGSHLADAISSLGINVIALDRVPFPYAPNSYIEPVVGEVADIELVDSLVRDVDVVVHLAAKPSVPDSWITPFETLSNNVVAASFLLDSCSRHSKPVYVASSSSIYGLAGSQESPYRPISPYGVSKAAMEMLFTCYQSQKGLKGGILRFFNVFGPRHRLNVSNPPVIAKLLECARQGTVFEAQGDGTQSRDFTFISDLVAAVQFIVFNHGNLEKPVEISFGKTTSLLQLIQLVEKVSDRHLNVRWTNPRIGDIKFSESNGSLARLERFQYTPTELESALRETWLWHSAKS